jgi:hypothetical protein
MKNYLKGGKKYAIFSLWMGFTYWHRHFLVCLAGMIYLLSKADAESKRTRREEKEKK